MLIFISQCKKDSSPQPDAAGGTADAAARADASPAPPQPAPAAALAIRWPAVLPCTETEFDSFFFPYLPDGADTVEWLSPAPAARFQFQVEHGGITPAARTQLSLPRIVAERPGWLRFLHNPEAAHQPFKFGLNCADAGFVHWDCEQGVCQPAVGFRPRPEQRATGFLATRYRLRWNCERLCKSRGRLAGLVGLPLPVLRGRHTSALLELARDVAADVQEMLGTACMDHGCSASASELAETLARFRKEPLSGPIVDETLAESEEAGQLVLLDAPPRPAPPRRASVTSDVRIGEQQLRIQCFVDEFLPAANPTCRVELKRNQDIRLSAFLDILAGDEGWVYTSPLGSIGIHRAVAGPSEDAQLVLHGGAVHTLAPPSAPLPPPPALPPPQPQRTRTVWPKDVRCKRFDTLRASAHDHLLYASPDRDLRLEAAPADAQPADAAAQRAAREQSEQAERKRSVSNGGVTGFVWSGGGERHRYPLGEVKLPADFSAAQRLEVEPTVDPARYQGPHHRIGLGLELRCADPEGADVRFDCGHGACKTTQSRSLSQPAPVGGRFLGPGGWQCAAACPRQKPLAALLTASLASLQGAQRARVGQLVRDVLGELQAVLELGYAGGCRPEPLAARQAAGRLLGAARDAQVEVVPRQKHAWDPEDIRGWTASLVHGQHRFAVTCTRETTSLGMEGTDIEDACIGALSEGARVLARYHPRATKGSTQDDAESVDSYEQTVDLRSESISIESRGDAPPRPQPADGARRRVEGSIRITAAAD